MIDATNPNDLVGAPVLGEGDSKIGTVGQVYVDDETGRPAWVTLKTGLFGSSESFAPLTSANWDGSRLHLPLTKEFVKDAPRIADDGSLSPEEEDSLYAYYGGDTRRAAGTGDVHGADRTAGTTGYDTSGPTTDDAMTRSEERLHVGTERVETGRARLRKHIVTEQQTVTVPVEHEEVRLEREPITDANIGDALDGPAISSEEHEVTLTAERVVVDKEAVPVERVRLDTDTVTEHRQVSEDVRKEVIELDDPDSRTAR